MPDGTFAYTRDGSFQMDAQGRIVTAQGNPVQPTITIPQNSSGITINAQGQVSVTLPGSTTPTIVGQIGLTRFINKAGLQPIGDNLFTDTPASGAPQDGIANTDGFGDMQQGNLEQANVEVVSEISDLIAAQRAYEMNAKVISAADQMLQSTSACSAEGVDDDRPLAPPRNRPARAPAPRAALGAEPRRRSSPRPCCAPTSPSPATWCGSATSSTMPARAAQIAIYRAPDLGTTGSLPIRAGARPRCARIR